MLSEVNPLSANHNKRRLLFSSAKIFKKASSLTQNSVDPDQITRAV